MTIYRVQTPDGILRIEGPENATEAQLIAAAKAHSMPADPTDGMSTYDKAAAGVGSGMMDLYLGAKQRLGMASEQDVADKRKTDAPLVSSGAGKYGQMAGQALPALATLPIPGLNTLAGATATGAALGSLQPTTADESVAGNVLLGGVGGLAGQAGANAIGRIVAPVRGALNPEQQRLAKVLQDSGVKLDLAQQTGSKPLRIINSVLDNLPITSGREEAKKAAQKQAFSRAVLEKSGTNADAATPEVLDAAFNRLGGNFNDIYSRNAVKVDNPLMNDMVSALDKADNAAPIVAKTDKIMRNGPDIPGQKYQDIRTQLRTLQGSADPEVQSAAKDLKYALDNAATRSVSAKDAALLAETRQQYANLMPVAKAMKASNGVNGEIPVAQLRTAVANADPRGYVRGKGDLNDLARAGSGFLSDSTPNSGTAQRFLYQSLLSGGLGLGSGAGGLLSGQDPMGAAGTAATGLGMGLLGPVIAQKALNNGLLTKYLNSSEGRKLVAEEMKRYLAPMLIGGGALAAPRP